MASKCYNKGITKIGDGTIVYTSATIGVLLMKSSYVQNPDSNFVADISADEISVSGYSRQTLGTKAVTQDDTNNRAVYSGADVTFSALAAGQTIGSAVIYRNTGSDATSELIAYCELSSATATNGSDVIIDWPATGIFYGQI